MNPWLPGPNNTAHIPGISQPAPVDPLAYRSTFDKAYRLANPLLAGRGELKSPDDPTNAFGYRLGGAARRLFNDGQRTDLRSLMTNGGLGALAGVAGSYAWDAVRARRGDDPLGWLGRSLFGLGGAGLGALLTQQMRGGSLPRASIDRGKSASTNWAAGAEQQLRRMLIAEVQGNPSIDSSLRLSVIAALGRIGGSDLQALARAVATVGGAAAGAVIARWLLGKGLIPSLAGAAAGAMFGLSASRPRTNALGRQSLDDYR